MIRGGFRPWGKLEWVLGQLFHAEWSLIGSIATGERSLAVWEDLCKKGICANTYMLKVSDTPSPYWGDETNRRLEARTSQFIKSGGNDRSIHECHIMDSLDDINRYADQFIEESGAHIVIDISTFPKRFFFPLIRRILCNSDIDTIVATYTRPIMYDKSRPLARDPSEWQALPGFLGPYPEPKNPKLFVALGYEPLGLPQILKEGAFDQKLVRLFFPFPSTPEGYLKNWEFVRNLESETGHLATEPIRVHGYDVSSVFDTINSHTDSGSEYAVFAPYGTKPMSLAMCLFSVCNRDNTAVFYTQPASYNPLYSSGVRRIDGFLDSYAYCIRIGGRDLYTLS